MDRRAEKWKQLDEVLQNPYETEDGRKLVLRCAAFDSGGAHHKRVYG